MSKRKFRRNSDDERRSLERAAAGGDNEAKIRLLVEKARAGELSLAQKNLLEVWLTEGEIDCGFDEAAQRSPIFDAETYLVEILDTGVGAQIYYYYLQQAFKYLAGKGRRKRLGGPGSPLEKVKYSRQQLFKPVYQIVHDISRNLSDKVTAPYKRKITNCMIKLFEDQVMAGKTMW